MTPSDRSGLRAHLLRLHADDRRQRFLGLSTTMAVRRYVRRLDFRQVIVIGCWVGRSLRGVCELHRAGHQEAEIAISVERAFQRRGIGAELLRRMLIVARNRGIPLLVCRCLPANFALRRLIERFDGQTRFDSPEASGEIHPLPATPATLASEFVDEAGVLGLSLMRCWLTTVRRGVAASDWRRRSAA